MIFYFRHSNAEEQRKDDRKEREEAEKMQTLLMLKRARMVFAWKGISSGRSPELERGLQPGKVLLEGWMILELLSAKENGRGSRFLGRQQAKIKCRIFYYRGSLIAI